MDTSKLFGDVTVERLREIGGSKWARIPGTIGAFIAEMDFGMAPEIADRLHRAIDDGQVGYLSPQWVADLREATASFYERLSGARIDPDWIIEVPDVVSGIQMILRDFLRPDARVVLPTPAYMPFLWIPPLLGHPVIQVPMIRTETEWQMDFDAIDQALRPGDLLLLTNPHNPIGKVYSEAELRQIGDIIVANRARLLSDELHAPLIYEGEHVSVASLSEEIAQSTITAISASKSWNLAGLKCAQLILTSDADRERAPALAEHEPSTLGVFANTVAYTQGLDWLEQTKEYLRGNRDLVSARIADVLPGVRYLEPKATYLAWLDLPQSGLGDQIAPFFQDQAGVALTPGIECGDVGQDAVRLNFGTTLAILNDMLDRIGAAYQSR